MVRRKLKEVEHLAEEYMNRNNSLIVSSNKTVDKTSNELVKRCMHANQQSINNQNKRFHNKTQSEITEFNNYQRVDLRLQWT
jgi:hypothetical protein